MMKFINAFPSTDLMRNFLKSIDCLHELLLLEEETGNFLEAVHIAKKKGDIIRQAYLLGKAAKFEDASVLILQFVLANSLWSSGSKGWPLKEFSQKEELLEKAKSLAKNVSSNFYEYVCVEADILSSKEKNFIIMEDWFSISHRCKNVEGEMLALRKILDFHLGCNASKYSWEEKFISDAIMHGEKISMETFFWKCWRDNTLKIFDCLGRLTTDGVNEYGNFCLSFLGVSREVYNQNDIYFLLNSDAYWVRDVGGKSVRKNSKLVSLDVCYLISSARNYWCLQMLDLGLKVLTTLENLYHLSTKNSLSLFLQSRSLIHIFEVAKFLLETKHLDRTYKESQTLRNYIVLAISNFVNCMFPLDLNMSLDENIISLRNTPVAGELLQRNIAENASSINSPSHGQIGRVAMIILGSAKLSSEPFESIAIWSDESQPWKLFFQRLREVENQPDISLVWRFHQALNETYTANWVKERDHITPFCFLYLLERILIMASSFNGYFITTKSSFVEWLTYYRGDYKQSSNLPQDLSRHLEATIRFLVNVSGECLINKEQMTHWLYKSSIKVKEYYPTLVLRFFIIICLLHVNFGVGLPLLYDFLGKNYITNHLPVEFYNTLQRRRGDDVLNNFAKAFRKTGNPMVIVNLWGKCPVFMSRGAISVDTRDVHCLEDVLPILFPKIVVDREKAIALNPFLSEDNGPEKVLDVSKKKLSDSPLTEHKEDIGFEKVLDVSKKKLSDFAPTEHREDIDPEKVLDVSKKKLSDSTPIEDKNDIGPEKVLDVSKKKLSNSAPTEHREEVSDENKIGGNPVDEEGDGMNLVLNAHAIKVDLVEKSELVTAVETEEIEDFSLGEDLYAEELSFSGGWMEKLCKSYLSISANDTIGCMVKDKTSALGAESLGSADEEESSKANPIDGATDSTRQDSSKKKKKGKNNKKSKGAKRKKKK